MEYKYKNINIHWVYKSLDTVQILFEFYFSLRTLWIFLKKPKISKYGRNILSSTNDNCEKEGSSELELEQTVSNLFEHVKTYTILLTVTRQDSIYAIYNGTPIALAAPFWHRLPPRIVIPSKLFEIKKVKLWHKRKRAYVYTLFMLQAIIDTRLTFLLHAIFQKNDR